MATDPEAIAGSSVAPESIPFDGAVREITTEALLSALSRAIDLAEPRVKDAFLQAIADLTDSIDYRDLAVALAADDLQAALAAIPFDKLETAIRALAAKATAHGDTPGILASPFNAGVDLALASLPSQVAAELDSNEIRSEAADWLVAHGADLAQSLTAETRDGIRTILSSAMDRGGEDVFGLGKDISGILDAQTLGGLIGLNDRQADTLNDYIDSLTATDLSAREYRNAIDSRYQEMLDYRGEMIARTEASFAGNAGQNDVWNDAVDEGALDKDVYEVEWVASPGACDDCDGYDGMTRPIDGSYDDEDAGDGPPAHPNCRCGERLVNA